MKEINVRVLKVDGSEAIEGKNKIPKAKRVDRRITCEGEMRKGYNSIINILSTSLYIRRTSRAQDFLVFSQLKSTRCELIFSFSSRWSLQYLCNSNVIYIRWVLKKHNERDKNKTKENKNFLDYNRENKCFRDFFVIHLGWTVAIRRCFWLDSSKNFNLSLFPCPRSSKGTYTL